MFVRTALAAAAVTALVAGGAAAPTQAFATSAEPDRAHSQRPSTIPFGPGLVDLASGVHVGIPTLAPGGQDLPLDYAVLGGRILFPAETDDEGVELWVSDGTPGGTRLLRDIYPGPNDGHPTGLTVMGGRVYFAAYEPGAGDELWSTDGTAAGTVRVADIQPGDAGSGPLGLTAVGSRLYFSAFQPATGTELWVMDQGGQPRMVVDLQSGADGSHPYQLTPVFGGVVFAARAGGSHDEVHVFLSRGTAATTERMDVELPETSLSAFGFTDIGSTVVFSAGNAASGSELWRTDGTSRSARGVKDIWPGVFGSFPRSYARLGNTALFTAETPDEGRELWSTDGTAGGTQRVRDIDPSRSSAAENLLRAGDTVYFRARDPFNGVELWQTQGSLASTKVAADTAPGSASGYGYPLIAVGRRLLFSAATPGTGEEPWIIDSATGRSRMLGDLDPGAGTSEPFPVGSLGNTVLFIAEVDGDTHLLGYTAATSSTRASAKKTYSAQQATKKRIRVSVTVSGEVVGLRGAVTILEGSKVVGRGTLVNGAAKVRVVKKLKPGRHRLHAVYGGSLDAQTSRSATFVVRVRR